MKRTILDKFDTAQSRIDPKFKSKLRTQLQIAEAKNGRAAAAANRRSHRRFWLVPAGGLALAVIVTLVGINVTRLTDTNSPLHPQTVSAAEILKRSIKATSQFDASKFTYFHSRQTLTYGPAFSTECNSKGTVPSQTVSDFQTYSYRAKDNGVEAYYQVTSTPGYPVYKLAVYDTTAAKILYDDQFTSPTNLQGYLGSYIVNGYPAKLFVDKNGKPQDYASISPTIKDGKRVYEFYTKPNPKSLGITPDDPYYSCSVDRVDYTAVDASSYLLVESTSYRGNVAPNNLQGSYRFDAQFENLSQSAALAKMRQAGFDQATALPTLPVGKDGLGLSEGEGI